MAACCWLKIFALAASGSGLGHQLGELCGCTGLVTVTGT
jgi:hypothetical protein